MSDFRSALFAWFDAKVENLENGVREAGIDTAEKGANITKHHIETRGTAKSGKRGRIETSAMLNSVDDAILKDTKDEVITRFGYSDAPYYTVFQELGTARVEAMYALADAAEEVVADLVEDIERAVKNA